jgi:hypothetical protein
MIKINNIFTVGDGYYSGERILLLWINKSKNISMFGKRFTQANGRLIKNNKRINVILEFLKDDDSTDYTLLAKIDLIRKIKRKDLKAKKEYILRYKKLPKF